MCSDVNRHVCKHVCRHVCRQVLRLACRHVGMLVARVQTCVQMCVPTFVLIWGAGVRSYALAADKGAERKIAAVAQQDAIPGP